jgi:hypothetical protein
MIQKLLIFFFIVTFQIVQTNAQTLGGNAVFTFLNHPSNAQLSALGGINISLLNSDISLAASNPALLRTAMNHQMHGSFNAFFAGIKDVSFTAAFGKEGSKLNTGAHIHYINYGSITQTDAAGNITGNFRATDYVVQGMASLQYKNNWWLGSTLKFIQSSYGQYRSNGIAMDIGLNYSNTDKDMQIALLIKNIGTQLQTYSGEGSKTELPFDMQLGVSKKLAKAPFQFSLTAHHLHRLNIYYNDSLYKQAEGDESYRDANTLKKIFSHLIFSTQIIASEKIEINLGYNFLRRNDLNAFNVTNGLNGFTVGVALKLKKLHFRYATGFFQRNNFHQMGLTLNLKGKDLLKEE